MKGILQEPNPNDCAGCGGTLESDCWVLATTEERFCWECASARISRELDAAHDEEVER